MRTWPITACGKGSGHAGRITRLPVARCHEHRVALPALVVPCWLISLLLARDPEGVTSYCRVQNSGLLTDMCIVRQGSAPWTAIWRSRGTKRSDRPPFRRCQFAGAAGDKNPAPVRRRITAKLPIVCRGAGWQSHTRPFVTDGAISPLLSNAICASPRHRPARALRLAPLFGQAKTRARFTSTSKKRVCWPSAFDSSRDAASGACCARGAVQCCGGLTAEILRRGFSPAG